MKVDFQLEKRKLEGALLMLKFVKSSKQSRDIMSEFRWWSTFVPTEVLFLRLSFFEQRTSGFPRVSMAIGDFLAILKVGLAMFTECGTGGTGINPFGLTKVLTRVASPSPSTQTRPSGPPIPTTPFNDAVFTSSPIDFNDVRTANITLNDMIASGNPISTPAKKYVTYLTKNVERLQVVNTIVQYKKKQLKAHVHGKKR